MPDQHSPSNTSSIRDRAIDGFITCYETNGTLSFSMSDVTKKAKMSRATLYRHFDKREDLLQAALDRELQAARAQVEVGLHGIISASTLVIETLLELIEILGGHPLLGAFLDPAIEAKGDLGEQLSRSLQHIVHDLLSQRLLDGQEDGIIREDIDVAMMIAWICRILGTYLQRDNSELSVSDKLALRRELEKMLIPSLLSH